MKKILFIIILYFCFNLTSYSQIYATYDEVIEYYGKDYTVENSDYYDLLIKFDIKKDFGNQWNLFGFIILESGKKVCNYVHIMEPKSRTNYWINYLNEKGYVKIDQKLEQNMKLTENIGLNTCLGRICYGNLYLLIKNNLEIIKILQILINICVTSYTNPFWARKVA